MTTKPNLPDSSYFEYFNANPPDTWGFEQYEKYVNKNRERPLRKQIIKSQYETALNNIKNLKDLDGATKSFVSSLLQDLKTPKNDRTSNIVNNYGTIGHQVNGNVQNMNVNTLPQKRQLDSVDEASQDDSRAPLDTNEHESDSFQPDSFLTETTDSSFDAINSLSNYGELLKQRQYVLIMKEFDDIDFHNNRAVDLMDREASLDERLHLSSIIYEQSCPEELSLKPTVLPDEAYSDIRNWRRLKKLNKEYFPPPITPSDPPTEGEIFKRNLGVFLVNLRESLDRPPFDNNDMQSEIDFSVQNVSILLRFVFNSKARVSVTWEKPSLTNEDSIGKMTTTDFLIYHCNQELGCGEVKVNNADKRLEEEDRTRLGETLKKQLHNRIKEAKSEKEFYTFGVFVGGEEMELYCMSFSKENGYRFFPLDKIKLPTLDTTYTALEESLEILFSFKESIVKTLKNPSEIEQPFIYRGYYNYFKPTVSFLD